MIQSLPFTSSIHEDFEVCEVLLSLKNLVLWRKKRNTLRRKRRNFDCAVFRSINKWQRKVPPSKTVQKKSKKKSFRKVAKLKLPSVNCFWTDFTLEQLFGAKDVEEIQRTAAIYDFSTQGQLSLSQRQKGWIVEIVPRKDGSKDDTYYTHGKTNLRFRSLKQIREFIRDLRLPH